MSGNITDTSGKYVASIAVANGRIDITYGHEANSVLTTGPQTLSLTPYETPDRSVAWRCGAAPAPVGTQLLGTGTAAAATYSAGTLGAAAMTKYLPAACR